MSNQTDNLLKLFDNTLASEIHKGIEKAIELAFGDDYGSTTIPEADKDAKGYVRIKRSIEDKLVKANGMKIIRILRMMGFQEEVIRETIVSLGFNYEQCIEILDGTE